MISNLIDMVFWEIGKNFTTEAYMLTTKVQGILWSISDIIIIYFMLKIYSVFTETKDTIIFFRKIIVDND